MCQMLFRELLHNFRKNERSLERSYIRQWKSVQKYQPRGGGTDSESVPKRVRSLIATNPGPSFRQSQPCHEWEGTPRMTQERVYIGCDGCKSCNPGRSEPRQSVLYPINPLNARIYPWPSSRLRWTWDTLQVGDKFDG